jgi:hypothetical protein
MAVHLAYVTLIDDPARLLALARRQARRRMLDVRQRAQDFDQARREANAAAALLEMEGGAASNGAEQDKAIDDATADSMDIDPLEKTTGLKDRKEDLYLFEFTD